MADGAISVGKGKSRLDLDLALANRHGLIAGATGTGKSVTLKVLAEGLSAACWAVARRPGRHGARAARP